MPKETQNSGNFNIYVWMKARTFGLILCKKQFVAPPKSGYIYSKFPDICVTKRLQFHVQVLAYRARIHKRKG